MTTQSEKLRRLNAASTATINANVSPSLHPDQLANHGPICVDAEHSGTSIDAYTAGRGALKAMYESAAQIDAARQSVLKPMPMVGAQYAKGSAPVIELVVPPERVAELASAMASSASRAAANVERNIAVVERSIDKLSGFISQKTSHARPNDAALVAEASEIRRYITAMKPGLRMPFLQEACEKGDAAVVFAALNSSPFASGLDRTQHGILREFANEKFAGVETAQRAALVDIKKKIDQGMRSYSQHYAKRLPKLVADASAAPMAALKGATA